MTALPRRVPSIGAREAEENERARGGGQMERRGGWEGGRESMCAALGLRVGESVRAWERERALGCIVTRARALKIGSLSEIPTI